MLFIRVSLLANRGYDKLRRLILYLTWPFLMTRSEISFPISSMTFFCQLHFILLEIVSTNCSNTWKMNFWSKTTSKAIVFFPPRVILYGSSMKQKYTDKNEHRSKIEKYFVVAPKVECFFEKNRKNSIHVRANRLICHRSIFLDIIRHFFIFIKQLNCQRYLWNRYRMKYLVYRSLQFEL